MKSFEGQETSEWNKQSSGGGGAQGEFERLNKGTASEERSAIVFFFAIVSTPQTLRKLYAGGYERDRNLAGGSGQQGYGARVERFQG